MSNKVMVSITKGSETQTWKDGEAGGGFVMAKENGDNVFQSSFIANGEFPPYKMAYSLGCYVRLALHDLAKHPEVQESALRLCAMAGLFGQESEEGAEVTEDE